VNSALIVLAVIAAILGFLSSVTGFLTVIYQNRKLFNQGAETHNMVNSQHDAMVNRQNQLTKTLVEADVPIPPAEHAP
jgi:UPF0716 family protein affecting phage T7 exclusion